MAANQQGFFQAITARLRSETTLPIKWIAAWVQIGTVKGAKSVLPHLACALAARAEFIITRDPDLLELETPLGIQMLTPRAFLSRLPTGGSLGFGLRR